jgi:catechol 2,3-dioxygenase-like lactoylglutathione lyase family enzyme
MALRSESVHPEGVIHQISHILLQVRDLDESLHFYVDTLGFQIRHRGTLDDGREYVNTLQGLGLTTWPPDEVRGRTLDHMAFRCPSGIAPVVERLRAAAIPHEEPRRTPYGLSVYFRDPDGNRIECHDSTGIGA